jgi:GNAT superfamily N-acetyltransferase
MTIEIAEAPMTDLSEYARIPIVFTVDRVVDVIDGADGFVLSERRLDVPFEKNYDALDGEGPLHWPSRFDLSNWSLFVARIGGRRVGGAAVTFEGPGLTALDGRRDVAILWDIRVSPDARGQGVGSALFDRVEEWARSQGCRQLKAETQNTNVRACRFYERVGCELRAVHREAYPELPGEIQLLWYKELLI